MNDKSIIDLYFRRDEDAIAQTDKKYGRYCYSIAYNILMSKEDAEEVTLLSLQGIQGTPGYQATKEWYEWLKTYDTDGTVWDSHEAYGADFGDEYDTYGIYSQEMNEKLDEICKKYDLKLMGKMYEDPDPEAACEALQIQGFFRPGVQVKAAAARRRAENYYMGFGVDMTTQAWYPPEGYADSFESYIPYILKYASPENHYYTLLDLDGDGTEELLWGTQDGHIREVAVMVDGRVTLRFDDYLCEGNILLCELNHDEYAPGGAEFLTGNLCTSYQYNTLSERIVKLYDLPERDKWVEVRPGQEDRIISEAEAKQIMARYPVIRPDMKPLSEYPLP